jgi:hypothetical protein
MAAYKFKKYDMTKTTTKKRSSQMAKVSKAKSKTSSSKKSTKKISFASKNKKALIVLVAALFVAVGIAGVMQTYALTNIKICNSSASAAKIEAYKTDWSWHKTLSPNYCSSWVNNTGSNPVRVDVEYDFGGVDVDSYKLGRIGSGYGPCHTNSENSASNPPDDASQGVRYRNYRGGSC